MSVLLSLSQTAHADIVLFEPTGNSIGITPLIFRLPVNSGYFHSAQLFFHVLLYEPIFVLIKSFSPQSFAHKLSSLSWPAFVLHILIVVPISRSDKCPGVLFKENSPDLGVENRAPGKASDR